jgi:hypothetical protein
VGTQLSVPLEDEVRSAARSDVGDLGEPLLVRVDAQLDRATSCRQKCVVPTAVRAGGPLPCRVESHPLLGRQLQLDGGQALVELC